jgi:hypothetical protein
MKGILKKFLFGRGIKESRIRYGAAKGIKMKVNINDRSQRLLGLEEREIQPAFGVFAKACKIFVDIGASDGYYGLLYHKINRDGVIFMCDSQYRYATEQKDNFIRNGFLLDRVNFISKYVCDFSDDTHIDLDNLLKEESGNVFFKIDVDGGELEVLKGVKKVLKERHCRLVIETHSKELEDGCISFLQEMGYVCRIIPNGWWRVFIPEKRPIEHNRWLSAQKS